MSKRSNNIESLLHNIANRGMVAAGGGAMSVSMFLWVYIPCVQAQVEVRKAY